MIAFSGVFSVLPTPFDPAGEVDLESLKRVIDLYLAAGVDGLTVLGVTGEADRLDDSERLRVLESTLDHVAGRCPVVVGSSARSTEVCIRYARQAEKAGASAVMISPPPLLKPHSEVICRHFREVAGAVSTTIVIQDYPPVSGYYMEPELLVRISREIESARVIKLEDPPTPAKTARILEVAAQQTASVDPPAVLGGLGGVFLFEELLAGASGTMTGFAYPELLVRITRLFRDGRLEEAQDLFYRFLPLLRFEFQPGVGIALRKEILRRRGALRWATVRRPGGQVDPATTRALDLLLDWMKGKGEAPWTWD